MIVLPAVDIRGGRCVRLYQGRGDRETVYGDSPAAMALRWQREGAQYLHVVDLDGAFTGEPQNLGALKELLEGLTIPVEFGGGLRHMDVVEQVFRMGVDRVILGTAAVSDRGFLKKAIAAFGRRVFVGLDVKNGRIAVEGWTRETDAPMDRILREIEEIGAGGIVCTDVSTDGTLAGPNTGMIEEIVAISRVRIIASGGVRSADHLRRLATLHGGALYGAIVGRALYTGDLTMRDALKAASGAGGSGGPC